MQRRGLRLSGHHQAQVLEQKCSMMSQEEKDGVLRAKLELSELSMSPANLAVKVVGWQAVSVAFNSQCSQAMT